jgi:hypothetical protein
VPQQAQDFIDDEVPSEPAGWRVSVRPLRLSQQFGRYPAIREAFRPRHLSGLQDGHEPVARHISPDLPAEVASPLWFEVTKRRVARRRIRSYQAEPLSPLGNTAAAIEIFFVVHCRIRC